MSKRKRSNGNADDAARAQAIVDGPALVRSIAEEYTCPITKSLPVVPVVAPDGYVYDRNALRKHFESNPDQVRSRHRLPTR